MSDAAWGQGYITDAHYADTYFRELSPTWLTYVAALHGVETIPLDRPFSYLELGCGFGHSAIVHAAAFPRATFHACDFNPVHVTEGTRYAETCGVTNVHFIQSAFERLRDHHLPDCDFIVLHGVWSWVDADTRASIRQVVADRLKPGGLLYLSYNCFPGWAIEIPIRRLLMELAIGAEGPTAGRTAAAIAQLQELRRSGLRYFKAHQPAADAVDTYARGSAHYVAHEFLNQAWEPFYSLDVADDMASIDLRYVGSATLPDNHHVLMIDERSAEACARLPTARQQQLALDFAVNRRFRRDVFVKAPPPPGGALSTVARSAKVEPSAVEPSMHSVVGCINDPASLATTAKVPRGQVSFQEAFIRDLRRLLARGSMTIGDIAQTLSGPQADATAVAGNVELLVAADSLAPFARAQGAPSTAPQRQITSPVGARVLEQIVTTRTPRAIPSEALGFGLVLNVTEAEAVLEWLNHRTTGDAHATTIRRLQQIGVLV